MLQMPMRQLHKMPMVCSWHLERMFHEHWPNALGCPATMWSVAGQLQCSSASCNVFGRRTACQWFAHGKGVSKIVNIFDSWPSALKHAIDLQHVTGQLQCSLHKVPKSHMRADAGLLSVQRPGQRAMSTGAPAPVPHVDAAAQEQPGTAARTAAWQPPQARVAAARG